jgi:nucleotide-binding universal stress UspA family protein
MRLLEAILVPVDFSDGTGHLLRSAAAISRTFRSEIILQNVLPPFDARGEPRGRLLDMACAGASSRLEECRKTVEMLGGTVRDALVDQGVPTQEIVARALEHDVNVVMLGAANCPKKAMQGLGLTADEVRRRSPKPVWLVRPGLPQPPRSIVCPVDFSAVSKRALRNAVHLARQLEASLTVVTVIPPSPGWTVLSGPDENAENQRIDWETKRFERFLQQFDFHKVRWEKVLLCGEPAERIVELIQRRGSDLLIMGSAGRSGLWRMLAGSTTDKVAARVGCSMITMMDEDAVRLRIDEEQTDVETHYNQGCELLDQGFPEEARRQFKHCVNANRLFVPAWKALAGVYDRLGKEGRKEECLATAERVQEELSWRAVEADIRAKHPLLGDPFWKWEGGRHRLPHGLGSVEETDDF